MMRVLLIVVVTTIANALAFRESLAATNAFFWYLIVPYAGLTALALRYFWHQGTLLDVFAPRRGDIAIGALTALVLLLASWLGRSALAPSGTPRQAWLYRLYLQLGDPEVLQHSAWLTLAILFICIAEEVVWRGWLLDLVTERLGSRRGWIAATALYTLSVLPSVFLLRDPLAGANPLLPTAALGAGLVWTFLAARLGRLPPAIVSHVVFTYFSAVQFRWPGT